MLNRTVLATLVAITVIFVSIPVLSQEVQGLYELNKHIEAFNETLQAMKISEKDFKSDAKSLRKQIIEVKQERDKFEKDSTDWLDKNADLIELTRELATMKFEHRKKIKELAEKGKKVLDAMKRDLKSYEKQRRPGDKKDKYYETYREGCKKLAFTASEIFENAKMLGLKNDKRVKIKMANTERMINRVKLAKKSRQQRVANLDGFKRFIYYAEEVIDTNRTMNLFDLGQNVEELDFIKIKTLENLIALYQKKINRNLKQAEELLPSNTEILDNIELSPSSTFFEGEEADISEPITTGW